MRPILSAVALAAVTLVAAAPLAEAKSKASASRPLVVKKRSFLDAGVVAPVGSMRNYVTQTHELNVHTPRTYQPSAFGGETLPGRFDLPGRPQPLFTF